MDPSNFEIKLSQYAELALRVGLNLQPGQRLLITNVIGRRGPGGCSAVRQLASRRLQRQRARLWTCSGPTSRSR
jgi:hypothetical protein